MRVEGRATTERGRGGESVGSKALVQPAAAEHELFRRRLLALFRAVDLGRRERCENVERPNQPGSHAGIATSVHVAVES